MTVLPAARGLALDQQITLLSGSDFWHTQPLPDAGIPALMLTDGPHGLRVQAGASGRVDLTSDDPATCFPTAVTLASSWDEDLAEEIGRAVGAEALALGVAVVLGPGMNIKRHPLAGRNFEYLSEDPLVTGRMAAAVVRGIQGSGAGACLKHFAANNQESHRFVVDAVVDERTLREIYLAGFEHAVTAAQPWVVMAAYNRLNGSPCTDNRRLLSTILREEWGFDGLVVSDWGATNDRVAAIEAGLDLEMPGSGGIFDQCVLAAVRSGRLDRSAVERCAQRVLDLVARSPRPRRSRFPAGEHHTLARRAAAEGTVLLVNDGVLPLSRHQSVALIGAFAEHPRYQGAGSSMVSPTRLDTALGAFGTRGADVTYVPGYDARHPAPDARLMAEAVGAARSADVAVVLVGLPGGHESEGVDRDDLRLPRQHDDLVTAVCAANPRTVVALSNGAPVLMPWADRPAAIVESYLGGQASGSALADVLYGDAEPGGRLAETFPAAASDVAADPFFPGEPHQVQYREGLFAGYRHHTSSGPAPLFPFGHGLSYTNFSWSAATADRDTITAGETVSVSLTVTNTGTRPGSDVVQVYVHDRTGVVLRPRRELRGFAKVGLQPGQAATVTLALGPRAFAYYDVERHGWAIPEGTFELEVARSSADIVQALTVKVTGGVTTAAEPAGTPAVAAADDDFRRRLRRPVPAPRPVRPFTRDSTVQELAATGLGRLLAHGLLRAMKRRDRIGEEEDPRAALERGLGMMPLRSFAQLSGGRLPWGAVDVLIDLLNGRPLLAAGRAGRGAAGVLRRRATARARGR